MSRLLFSPLKNRPFRMLFLGQVFSDTGNWLDYMVLTVLVIYHWKMGPGATAAILAAYGLPWVLIGPFASVWVDRLSRRNVMIVSNLARLVCVMGMIFCTSLPPLLLLVFFRSTAGCLFDPARQAAIRSVTSEEELLGAVSLSQMVQYLTKIAAPTIGGSVIAASGPSLAFMLEGGCFCLSALFILLLPALSPAPAQLTDDQNKESFSTSFLYGWRHIRSSRPLSTAIALMAIGMFIIFLYDGLLASWAKLVRIDEASYGILISSVGLGSVAGSLVTGQWNRWKRAPLSYMSLFTILSGVLVATIGAGGAGYFNVPLYMWAGLFFILGSLGSAVSIPYGYLLQLHTPADSMGRVSSIASACQTLSMLIAPAIGASLSIPLGVGGVCLAAGAVQSLTALCNFVLVRKISPVRAYNREEAQSV